MIYKLVVNYLVNESIIIIYPMAKSLDNAIKKFIPSLKYYKKNRNYRGYNIECIRETRSTGKICWPCFSDKSINKYKKIFFHAVC